MQERSPKLLTVSSYANNRRSFCMQNNVNYSSTRYLIYCTLTAHDQMVTLTVCKSDMLFRCFLLAFYLKPRFTALHFFSISKQLNLDQVLIVYIRILYDIYLQIYSQNQPQKKSISLCISKGFTNKKSKRVRLCIVYFVCIW